jgi:hypothetical protein
MFIPLEDGTIINANHIHTPEYTPWKVRDLGEREAEMMTMTCWIRNFHRYDTNFRSDRRRPGMTQRIKKSTTIVRGRMYITVYFIYFD